MQTWPSHLIPNSMRWHLQFNTVSFQSPYNQSVQTHSFPGGMWQGQLTFKNITREQLDDIETFIYRLGGANGRFLMWDFLRPGRPAQGEPVVSQSGAQGGYLPTSGWLPNRRVIKKGDYFSVNNELKKVLEDVWSNAAGTAIIEFAPWLRKSPAAGTAIITQNPCGIFKLENDDQGQFQHVPLFSDLTLSIHEAFYV